MKYTITLLAVMILGQFAFGADVIDNFSGDGWKKSRGTPGKMLVQKGKLFLEDQTGGNAWVTAAKTYDVDLDKTPLLVIRVAQLSDKGQVKVIRKEPFKKIPIFSIAKPGVYTINLKERFRWKGKNKIEVMLYAIGDGGKITYNYVKFTDKLSKEELAEMKKVGTPPKNRPPFELVPLFNSCSYYFVTPPKQNVAVFFRKKGSIWQNALTPVWINEDQMYRGSIVGLDENTDYEFKIVSGDKILGTKSFKTWSSQVPVAKTIVLNANNFKGYLKITADGSPSGWIKYTAAPGFVLKNNGEKPLIELIEAKYILLEGLTLQGGSSSAVFVRNCRNVRFINCDISGWGLVGVQRFDLDGKFYTKEKRAINNNAGIFLSRSQNTVVERSYFHDPRNRANSWRYSHPAGPEGMVIDRPESTVVRFNDFIGSDEHRWNDAIEGAGNFYKDGGFNRDADIYGNMMTMSNDDCIEIDGGQQNVRVFLNKFENALCAVSIQGCMSGPSYVYRNLMVNLGDEFGAAGQIIKTSSHYAGKDAVSFIFNNTIAGNGRSLPLHRLFKIVAKNNIFAGTSGISGRAFCTKAETDYNLVSAEKEQLEKHGIFGKYPKFENEKNGLYTPLKSCSSVGTGVSIANFTNGDKVDMGAIPQTSNLVLPYRPIPVFLSKYQLNFTVKNGSASASQTVLATVGGKDFASDYLIRKNNVFVWFSVSPAKGKLKSGDKVEFTVSLHPEKMNKRSSYKGVFLVRMTNGYSRPVSIYATTDFKQVAKPNQPGVFNLYLEMDKPVAGKPYKVVSDPDASDGKCVYIAGEPGRGKKTEPVEYTFDIPRKGSYVVLMRVKSEEPVINHRSIKFSIDGSKMEVNKLESSSDWIWATLSDKYSWTKKLRPFKLKKGKHSIKILPSDTIFADMIVITDNPGIFDPK